MTAPLSNSHFQTGHHSREVCNSESTQMSLSKVLEPRSFRKFFQHRWSTFLRENYQSPAMNPLNTPFAGGGLASARNTDRRAGAPAKPSTSGLSVPTPPPTETGEGFLRGEL